MTTNYEHALKDEIDVLERRVLGAEAERDQLRASEWIDGKTLAEQAREISDYRSRLKATSDACNEARTELWVYRRALEEIAGTDSAIPSGMDAVWCHLRARAALAEPEALR